MCRGDARNGILSEVFGDRAELAQQYHDLLATDGIDHGHIGPHEAERLWERHIYNSVAIEALIPEGCSVVDVGSGAGLPGIPLALARPDLEITLLEPLQRRCTFLEGAVDNLGISDKVHVVRGRAEEHQQTYDIVTGRAVGPLKRMLPWCRALMEPQIGQAVLLKGSSAQDEIKAVDKVLQKMRLRADVLTVRAHADTEATTAVRIQG